MNKKLTSIFESQGPKSLTISEERFSDDSIFEEFIDCCFFGQVNFFNCSFEGSEMLGVTFSSCFFENCIFNDTIIRKSEVADCTFHNCQFIDCELTPRTNFFRTLFLNCQFSNVDFSFTFFSHCKFIKINLTQVKLEGTSLVELTTQNITFNNLQFNEDKPMRIFRSKKTFDLKEAVKVTNSLDFLKEIEADFPTSKVAPSPRKRPDGSNIKRPTQPLSIKSDYQEDNVLITKRNIRRWMTEEDHDPSNDGRYNQELYQRKLSKTIENPEEVLDGKDIHHGQTECKVYIKNQKNDSGRNEKFAVISDRKNGRGKLGSKLSEKEYDHLQKTGELDLSDLCRDPQTRVMNGKSVREADGISRAQDQNMLEGLTVRRSYNRSESKHDFIGEANDGRKIEIDMKGFNVLGERSLQTQVRNIIEGIQDSLNKAKDPSKLQFICDLSTLPEFLRSKAYNDISYALEPNELDQIDFLFV